MKKFLLPEVAAGLPNSKRNRVHKIKTYDNVAMLKEVLYNQSVGSKKNVGLQTKIYNRLNANKNNPFMSSNKNLESQKFDKKSNEDYLERVRKENNLFEENKDLGEIKIEDHTIDEFQEYFFFKKEILIKKKNQNF